MKEYTSHIYSQTGIKSHIYNYVIKQNCLCSYNNFKLRAIVSVWIADIDFISVPIFSLSIPPSSIGSVDVVDVPLLHGLAAAAAAGEERRALLLQVAIPPQHVDAPDEREQHRDWGEAKEDVEAVGFRVWNDECQQVVDSLEHTEPYNMSKPKKMYLVL